MGGFGVIGKVEEVDSLSRTHDKHACYRARKEEKRRKKFSGNGVKRIGDIHVGEGRVLCRTIMSSKSEHEAVV